MSVYEKMTALADAVREKADLSGTLSIDAMTAAVTDLTVGSGIDTTDATATSGDILYNKIAYANGQKIIGTIKSVEPTVKDHTFEIDKGYVEFPRAISVDVADPPQVKDNVVTIYKGYHLYQEEITVGTAVDGGSFTPVSGESSILLAPQGSYLKGDIRLLGSVQFEASNIRAGITMWDVTGTFSSDATAEKNDIIRGKTAYVNGLKVTGNLNYPEKSVIQYGYLLYHDEGGYGVYGEFTGDATASSTDILPGTSAYVRGVKIEGSMSVKSAETYTPGTADITITSGVYLSEDQTIKGDSNLTAENIKAGVSIFDVDGTFTSDADATASDIAKDKTAYVNGVKVVGTATGGGVNRLWIYKDGIITSPVAADFGNSSIQVPSRPGDMTFYVAADGMIIYKHDGDFNIFIQSKVRPVTPSEGWTLARAWRDTGKGVAVKDGRLHIVTQTYVDNERSFIEMSDSPSPIVELGHYPYERGCFVLTESGDAYFVNPEYSGTCAPQKIDIKISKLLNQAPITEYGEEVNQPAIDADGRVVLLNGSPEGSPSVTVLFADKAFDSPFVNYYHYQFEDYGEGGGGYSLAVNDRGMLFSRNASTGETAEVQNISSICQEKFLGFCHTDLSYSFDDDTGEEKMVPEPRTAAFCIAIDGTLWKLTAGCNSNGSLTGVVSEQVGEDTDWQYVPPCLNRDSSGFAQKGGKLYRLHFNNDLSTRLEEFYPSPTGKLIAVSWDDKGLWFDTEDKDVTSCGVLK